MEEFNHKKGISFVLTSTPKGEKYVSLMENVNINRLDIDYEHYSITYNWCIHKNPFNMPPQDRATFYADLETMKFDVMAEKNLSRIKEERKKRKLNIK